MIFRCDVINAYYNGMEKMYARSGRSFTCALDVYFSGSVICVNIFEFGNQDDTSEAVMSGILGYRPWIREPQMRLCGSRVGVGEQCGGTRERVAYLIHSPV